MNEHINIFIDTNIFLSFYLHTSDDICDLEKIYSYIINGFVKLWLPLHEINEFNRNRDNKLYESLNCINKIKFDYSFPLIMTQHKDFSEFHATIKDIAKKKISIVNDIILEIESNNLHQDILIKKYLIVHRK